MPSAEDLRAAYSDLGNWARHYSAVRATVSTSLASISVVLMYYSWDKNSRAFMAVSVTVMVVAFILLWVFTRATVVRMNDQIDRARELGLVGPAAQPAGPAYGKVMSFLTGQKHANDTYSIRTDVAFWGGVVFMLAYAAFVIYWFGWVHGRTLPNEHIIRILSNQPIQVK